MSPRRRLQLAWALVIVAIVFMMRSLFPYDPNPNGPTAPPLPKGVFVQPEPLTPVPYSAKKVSTH